MGTIQTKNTLRLSESGPSLGVGDTRTQFAQLAAVFEGASSRAKELLGGGKLSEAGSKQAQSLINERARA